jgi:flagellar assembly protein FliH
VFEDPPPEGSVDVAEPKIEVKNELRALKAADSEIRHLKSELRMRESELAEAKGKIAGVTAQMDAMQAGLEGEKKSLRDEAATAAAEQKKAAYATGHEEGSAKGYADGLAKSALEVKAEYEGKFSEVLKLMDNINKSVQDARNELVMGHTPQLIHLWELMLQKLLQVKVKMDPDVVSRVLENILSRVSDREKILIYLNGADVEMIEENRESMTDTVRGVKSFEIHADDHVDRGSCLIETNLGIYDARWRTQLEQVSSEVESFLMEIMTANESDDS